MATETPEQVEKLVQEEVKSIQTESVSAPKEFGEDKKPKVEALPTPVVPAVAEVEEKIENKEVEPPPVTEDVKKTDGEEKPKDQHLPSPVVTLVESAEKIEDKQIEPPLIEEVKKTDDTPVVEPPSVSEPQTAHVKAKPEGKTVVESIEKLEEESTTKAVEEKPVEPPKTVHVPEAAIEATEKKEQIEDLPVIESKVVVGKVETSEPVPQAEEKPQELSGIAQKVVEGSAVVEPKESVEIDKLKNEEAPAIVVEPPNLLKEEPVPEEKPLVTDSFPPTEVAEKGGVEDKEKELGGEADVVKGLPKGKVSEAATSVAESEAKIVKSEGKREKTVPTEEFTEPETKKEVEVVTSSIPATEVTEKSLEGEHTSRDIDLVAEHRKENIKDETVAAVETIKDQEVEKKVEEVTKTTAEEPVDEPQKPEVEAKEEESVQTGETELEKEKQATKTATCKVSIPESTKDGDDTKAAEDPPKEEVSVKSTQKQSNNFLSKMKHSLVKAKKAITGKSPNTKTPVPETKDDVKA